jgi:hypothetical protein
MAYGGSCGCLLGHRNLPDPDVANHAGSGPCPDTLAPDGTWRSSVAHLLWEQGVAGSNPVVPTKERPAQQAFLAFCGRRSGHLTAKVCN